MGNLFSLISLALILTVIVAMHSFVLCLINNQLFFFYASTLLFEINLLELRTDIFSVGAASKFKTQLSSFAISRG